MPNRMVYTVHMSPATVDRDQKKAVIAEAAVAVFARKGFGRTKMSDIAKEAGIGKGTIYEYFRSKEAVFSYAVERFMLDMNRFMEDRMAELTDPFERLEAFVRGGVDMLKDAGSQAQFIFQIWAEGMLSGHELIDLKEIYDVYRTSIGELLEEGINQSVFRRHDVDLTASVLIGAMDGLALQWATDPDSVPLDKATNALVALLHNGLAKR